MPVLTPIGDVRTLRRRAEAEVAEMRGSISPALYELRWPTDGGGVRLGPARVRLDPGRGPFVLCGLYASKYAASPGGLFSPHALVDVTANGRKLNDAPVYARDLAAGVVNGLEIDWPRPIIIEDSSLLVVDVVKNDPETGFGYGTPNISGGVLVAGGFHTTEAVAVQLRQRGEFWAASMRVATSAAAPNGVGDFIFARDTYVSYLLGNGAPVEDVASLTMQVGDANLTPSPLQGNGVWARSTLEPQSTINVPCRRGARWRARMDQGGNRTAYFTLLGAAKWV